MPKFIHLTTFSSGRPCAINAEHVIALSPNNDSRKGDGTLIHAIGLTTHVREEFPDVMAMLEPTRH